MCLRAYSLEVGYESPVLKCALYDMLYHDFVELMRS